ncbi:MAG: fatty acid desaturase [Deltaproteobacteria bacterium]|nr:fatty acid desaturase [Deltaproteobacteria bacterium]
MSDVSLASPIRQRQTLNAGEIVKEIGPDFEPSRFIYWGDLLTSALIGWAAFVIGANARFGSLLHVIATAVAIFALLRAALFIHEITHLKRGQIPGFELVWNLIVGIPFMIPSLMYVGSHMDHHKRTAFGTHDDPEYAPIAHWSRPRIAAFVLMAALVPLALPLRWGVIGPLSRVFPRMRRFVVSKLSTLAINAHYVRPMPKGEQRRRWDAQEAGAAAFVWAVFGAVLAGWIPIEWVVQWCIVGGGVLGVNQVRTLVAHGYQNEGEPMDTEAQLLDSINLRGWSLLTGLVAPVGLRYHALHHYLPFVPYHSLGLVHRRLIAELPQNAPYRATVRDGIDTLRGLWRNAAAPHRQTFSASPAAREL